MTFFFARHEERGSDDASMHITYNPAGTYLSKHHPQGPRTRIRDTFYLQSTCGRVCFVVLRCPESISMDGKSDGRNARLTVLRKNNEEVCFVLSPHFLSSYSSTRSSHDVSSLCHITLIGSSKAATVLGKTDV